MTKFSTRPPWRRTVCKSAHGVEPAASARRPAAGPGSCPRGYPVPDFRSLRSAGVPRPHANVGPCGDCPHDPGAGARGAGRPPARLRWHSGAEAGPSGTAPVTVAEWLASRGADVLQRSRRPRSPEGPPPPIRRCNLEGGTQCVIHPVAISRTYFSPVACQDFGEGGRCCTWAGTAGADRPRGGRERAWSGARRTGSLPPQAGAAPCLVTNPCIRCKVDGVWFGLPLPLSARPPSGPTPK